MRRKNTSIKSRKDIQIIFKEGHLLKEKGLKIFYKINNLPYSRILVTFPRTFKGAIKRNKTKRLFKEVFRKEISFSKGFFDFIFVIYPEMSTFNYVKIKLLLQELFLVF